MTRPLLSDFRFYPQTLRARLTLWNTLLLALVFALLGGALRAIAARNLLATVDADLRQRSLRHIFYWANLPWASHTPPKLMDKKPADKALEEAKKAAASAAGLPAETGPDSAWREPARERVFDLNGRQSFPDYGGESPWDRAAFLRSLRGESVFRIVRVEEVQARIYSFPLRRKSGQIAGVTQIAATLEPMTQALRDFDWAMLTLVPLGLLAAWGGGMLLTGRMLRPVRDITQAAERIGAQDLSQRLTVSGQDEFSELAATFNRMLERLEAAFERQGRFTADASHELRTPLTVIKSVASRFLTRSDLPDDLRRGLNRLDQAAGVMEQVTRDLLFLARADAGQSAPAFAPTPLAAILDAAVACVPTDAGPSLRNEAAASGLAVIGDAGQLTRLFVNLLDNALRHTPDDGCVTISARREGEWINVCVADTGAGIATEHLPFVTERFYRVDAARARAQGGAGLGLAICKSIAEAHGGELQIQSREGYGATVTATLRAAPAEASEKSFVES